MDKGQFKVLGIVCLVICGICLFVAVERYQTNAKNVKAMSAMQQGMFQGVHGVTLSDGLMTMEPATPTTTK